MSVSREPGSRPRLRAASCRSILLLAAFLIGGVPTPLLSEEPVTRSKIRYIFIVHKDIFDTSIPEENKWPYRTANKLHISTKDEVILREMLLQEGETFDPFLADESERAIRRLLRLRQVNISPITVDERTVDLMVEVHETWTTEPYVSLQAVGEDLSGKVGIRERNLLGRGKEINVFYEKDAGIINRSFSYGDPNLFGSRLRLSVDYDDSEDGLARAYTFGRPFYSSVTRWAATSKGKAVDLDTRLYDGGREIARLENRLRDFEGSYGRSFGSTSRRIRRGGIGYRFIDDRLSTGTSGSTVLREKQYHVVQTGIQLERVHFLKVNRIKLYDRQEDFNLGPALFFETGFSRNWPDRSHAATFLEVEALKGRRFGKSHFMFSTLKGEGRFEDRRFRNTRPRYDFEYYNHFSERQTLAFHFQGEYIIRPEADAQILLGGDRGLRGYQLNQFSGNKLLLANIEDRFFMIDDLWRVLALGSVVFWDGGYVWDRNQEINMKDLKMNVGAGLRIHISRSSIGHVLRLDVAYAIAPVKGESRTVITFGSAQAF